MHTDSASPQRGMSVVTLGTAGGPIWTSSASENHRSGIATAVVVDENVYLVDCGSGVGQRMVDSGLRFTDLRGIFITHLHSDHTIDLNSLMVMGGLTFRESSNGPVPILGPGERGLLPPTSPHIAEELEPVFPDQPTPGTAQMVDLLLRAHATDLNDRRRDTLAPAMPELFLGRDIAIPSHVGFHPNDNNHPDMEPFEIFDDGRVQVSAILVQHRPVAPAFAFRFDSEYGSVVISGDTAPSGNLVRLAKGADLLLHEAIDLDEMQRIYGRAGQANRKASMDHHRKAHTPPEEAGALAAAAGVRILALHHLVPSNAPKEVWLRAAETFAGELLIPQDLQVIDVRSADTMSGAELTGSGLS